MHKIKVSEIFYSLQGEGMFVGVPSLFLRTFGCNFSCSGFGMPKEKLSEERFGISAVVEKYEDLPLVSTGCDSYASWDPRFKHLSPVLTVSAIVDRMQQLLPNGRFSKAIHLIITGGEPLLGWQSAYPELINEIVRRGMGLTDITFETNGTQPIRTELFNYLTTISEDIKTTFSVSAKLPVSGEKWEDAIKPKVVKEYSLVPKCNLYLKFVVASEEDVQDAIRAAEEYDWAGVDHPVYLMPVGGTTEGYNLNEKTVAELCMKNRFRFSPRIQVSLWKNAWGT